MKKTVGHVMADLLAGYGVRAVFGVPGGQTMPLYYGIEDNETEIKHILVREEGNAAFAADAYARISGKLGACDATAGCGAIRFTPGMAESYNASIPVIAISSEMNSDWIAVKDRGCGCQQSDNKNIMKPVTKWQFCLQHGEKVAEMTNRAVQLATSGRPGPVYVEVPFDIFDDEYEGPEYKADERLQNLPAYRSTPDADTMKAALEVLKAAERPVMVVGGGAWTSGAREAVTALAETLSMPVATSLSGKGVMEETHALSTGVMGTLGDNVVANTVTDEADVILAVGYKFSQNSTNYWKFPHAGQKVIHLDIDDSEFGKTYPCEIGLLGDARETLKLMNELAGDVARKDTVYKRLEELRTLKAENDAISTREEAPILPQAVVAALNEVCDDNTIIACDASFSCGWAGEFFDVYGDRRVLFPRGMSGLGYGLPAGIGCAAAKPDANVIVLTGDGGLSYCLGEMNTLVEQGMNVKVVVLNNQCLAWIKWYQSYFWDCRMSGCDTNRIDFKMLAESFGLKGFSFDDPKTIKEELKKALSVEGPAVIDIKTTETEAVKYMENEKAVQAIKDDHKRLYGNK